ncbi:MAG: MerR family transcriptional regulator [Deltaproteobacteria bacterium]|nr:MAG: MerR family transcriptional regulator [Deltaproteobacteria bacterium]
MRGFHARRRETRSERLLVGAPWRDPSTAPANPSAGHRCLHADRGGLFSDGESELNEGRERDNVIRVGFGADGKLTRDPSREPAPSQPAPPRSDPRQGLYTVAEVARLFGYKPSRLRYWHRSGLLGPSARVRGRNYYTFQEACVPQRGCWSRACLFSRCAARSSRCARRCQRPRGRFRSFAWWPTVGPSWCRMRRAHTSRRRAKRCSTSASMGSSPTSFVCCTSITTTDLGPTNTISKAAASTRTSKPTIKPRGRT